MNVQVALTVLVIAIVVAGSIIYFTVRKDIRRETEALARNKKKLNKKRKK